MYRMPRSVLPSVPYVALSRITKRKMGLLCPRFCVNTFLDSRNFCHTQGRFRKTQHPNELAKVLMLMARRARCRICRSNEGVFRTLLGRKFRTALLSLKRRFHGPESAESTTNRCFGRFGHVFPSQIPFHGQDAMSIFEQHRCNRQSDR